jgi:DNA primase
MSIPKVFIDQVLEQTNIVDVIGRRLPLTKKGNNYWSLCPFHDDNNPSMAVNEDKQFFYCFVCQESGNAIHFLREYEGLDFVDAVETLASSLGLDVPYERTPQENFSSDLLDSAVSFYANNLKSDEAAHAKDYLKAR